ncbi:hypothetical protein [Streptomyces zinciresistens]|uniref:hypothetical protein n=1 Tax=Streptomyces zinciresistens TaxID=1073330 RepID=UPI0011123F92|nr:hypothetical protein [Streptomyces zinciresistens]
MTAAPQGPRAGWILRISARSAPIDDQAFEQQRQLLSAVAAFDPATALWTAFIGQLDARALQILQSLYDASNRFGTEVRLEPIDAPPAWQGPTFADDSDVAAIITARSDQDRPLGQLEGNRPPGPRLRARGGGRFSHHCTHLDISGG